MDSVQPAWPRDTRVLEFSSDARELARLVADWKRDRPRAMAGIVWYRVPTENDTRNWRWPTLAAVMEGREPLHRLELLREGENPVDLVLVNTGEAEERVSSTSVIASWNDGELTAADAVAGWSLERSANRVVFTAERDAGLRLLPGERRGIGWLRYDRPAQPELVLTSATR
jgi:hypothetical protein